MFSLICVQTNSWTNNGNVGDLKCHHAHLNAIVMIIGLSKCRLIFLCCICMCLITPIKYDIDFKNQTNISYISVYDNATPLHGCVYIYVIIMVWKSLLQSACMILTLLCKRYNDHRPTLNIFVSKAFREWKIKEYLIVNDKNPYCIFVKWYNFSLS